MIPTAAPVAAAAGVLAPPLVGPAAHNGVLFGTGADDVPRARDTLRRRSLALSDMFSLLAAYATMWLVAPPSTTLLSDAPFLLALPFWVVLNKALRLYDRDANRIHKSTLDEVPQIVQSISLGMGLMYFAGPLAPGVQVHRMQTMVTWAAAIVITTLARAAVRTVVRRSTDPERVLLVGSGEVAGMVADKLRLHPQLGVEIVGHVDDADVPHGDGTNLPWLGRSEAIERICRDEDIERVIIAFSSMSSASMLDVIRMAKRMRVKVSIVPRMFEVLGQSVEIDQIEGMTLLGLRPLARTASTRAMKRAIDIAGAAVGLLFAAPVMLVAAVAIKLTSSGPIFFRQPRIGRGNRPFEMLKLRTMIDGADALKPLLTERNEMGEVMFKIADDPRVTRVGRFLRCTSLDELPQLWNVLRGEMSLVGPRPLVPEEDGNVMGWHRARLDLTPGLTGPWQVMGRNQIPFSEMVKLDYLYVANWSLWSDVKLLLRTLPVVFGRHGA